LFSLVNRVNPNFRPTQKNINIQINIRNIEEIISISVKVSLFYPSGETINTFSRGSEWLLLLSYLRVILMRMMSA
jgi:hypothetical protein